MDKEIDFLRYDSFNDENDYSQLLEFNFHQKGIYLSYGLFQQIIKNINFNENDRLTLSFALFIPKYNASNINGLMIDDSTYVETSRTNSVIERVELPIAGVMKEDKVFYNMNVSSQKSIYIPNSVLEKYIAKYREETERILCYVYHDNIEQWYINTIPEGVKDEDVLQKVVETPWQPSSYVVTVDSLADLENVVKEIKELGFAVDNQYADSNSFALINENNKTILIAFLVILIIMLYGFCFYLKYLAIKDETESRKYLLNIGLNKNNINSIFYSNYLKNSLILFLITSLMFRGAIELFVRMQIISLIIAPKFYLFIIFFIMSIIIELVIPLILNKRIHSD